MDFGSSALNDDQLIELLEQIMAELGTREHYVRNLAQQVIVDAGEKRRIALSAIESALTKVRRDYELIINVEAMEFTRAYVSNNGSRLLSIEREGDLAACTELAARIATAKEIIDRLENPGPMFSSIGPPFWLEIENSQATVCCGDMRGSGPCRSDPPFLQNLASNLKQMLRLS
jgi:hypothetical protein